MNLKVLKTAEKQFLQTYPGGFTHPDMVVVGKRHKMDQLTQGAKVSFAKKNFDDPNYIVDEVVKLVGRSTLISMFEKPKFRDMAKRLSPREKEILSESIYELLHGKEKTGFELLLSELKKRRLAKWTLVSAVQTYYRPKKDVLIKPTTTKLIVQKLELDLDYKPTPTWAFYSKYRKYIKEMKTKVDERLAPSNPAFCGFLMITLGELEAKSN